MTENTTLIGEPDIIIDLDAELNEFGTWLLKNGVKPKYSNHIAELVTEYLNPKK